MWNYITLPQLWTLLVLIASSGFITFQLSRSIRENARKDREAREARKIKREQALARAIAITEEKYR